MTDRAHPSTGRRRVVVTGLGTISPFGDRPEEIHQALAEGRSALREIELFSTEGLRSDSKPHLAGEISFDPKKYLEGNIRPIDRTGRLAIIAAKLALEDSGWSDELRRDHEVSLVLGTMFGSVSTIAEFDRRAVEAGPKYAKPFDFANSVINAAAGQTAIWHGLRGVNSTVAGGASASLQAIAYAADMIRGGRADAVLAGGAEELCFESYYGFHQAGLLAGSRNGAAAHGVPLDKRRNGFRLGEGAVLLMLEDAAAAESRGARVLAEIHGYANTYDCSRGRDPEQATDAIVRALGLALDDAGLQASDIDVASVAANGSVAGDHHEARGLRTFFGDHLDQLSILAVKGQLGESLGAAGAFQTLALLEALRHGRVPPIAGLTQPLEDLSPALVRGKTGGGETVAGKTGGPRRGLVHALGFDGNTCALVLEKS